jgi:putative hydrolase of the HAD superfamily
MVSSRTRGLLSAWEPAVTASEPAHRDWRTDLKIFFDVDGVLIDGWHSKPQYRKPWDATIEEDLGIHREAFRTRFFESAGGTFESPMHACVRGACDLKAALAPILPSVGYYGSVDVFISYWFEKDSNLNRDVFDIVRQLARHPHVDLYLATAQEHYRAAYLWTDLGFSAYFKDIFYSARIGCLKGTPDFFNEINRMLDILPDERPLFFDDQEDVVAAARASGWDACVFDSVADLRQHPRLRGLVH